MTKLEMMPPSLHARNPSYGASVIAVLKTAAASCVREAPPNINVLNRPGAYLPLGAIDLFTLEHAVHLGTFGVALSALTGIEKEALQELYAKHAAWSHGIGETVTLSTRDSLLQVYFNLTPHFVEDRPSPSKPTDVFFTLTPLGFVCGYLLTEIPNAPAA